MATMIQIRNVPDELHRQVKARAALSGMSMSEFILRELKRVIERPSREEVLDRLARLPGVEVEPPPSDLVRRERDSR
jgi:plasmid stability protein